MNNKIVIIEDHPVLRNIYQKKFTAEGFIVQVAASGREGLDLINRAAPDLVILDLMLPDLNGVEVLKELRADPSFMSLPIFIFSNSDWAGEALAEGATMVISKTTCTPQQLVEMARNILPAAQVELQTKDADSEAELDILSTADLFTDAKKSRDAIKQILLVEDHADTRAIITSVLMRSGFGVAAAENHEAALRQAELKEFDLFLLNRHCPDGLGISLCRELRQTYPSKAVVMYSTAALAKEREEAINAGAKAYLTEPEEILSPAEILTNLFNPEINSGFTNGEDSNVLPPQSAGVESARGA